MSDAIRVAQFLAEVLEKLGVVYWIGGSMASSTHGFPRSTQDVDLVAELKEEHIDDFVAALENDFYIDRQSVQRAIGSQRSFNVIHLDSMYKADIFILGSTPYAQAEKARRRLDHLGSWPGAPKLVWFRKSGGVLTKQLEDIQQVLKVQAKAIDLSYLHCWAAELGVTDLLGNVLAESGITGSQTT